MYFINEFLEAFKALFNSSKFTLTLVVWGAVIVCTCAVTMSDVSSSRRKLWSFVISAIGAVGIMLHLESFEGLNAAETSTRLVMTNFVVMTLGGLGAGLLGLAITAEPDKKDAENFRHALFGVLERIYIYLVISSVMVFALCHMSSIFESVYVTDHQLNGLQVVIASAVAGCLLSVYRFESARWDEIVGIFLFLFLLVVLAIYANALTAIWGQAKGWLLGLNVLLAFFVMMLSRHYRNKTY
ncbi:MULTISPECIES: hypothetical protein [unclassified Pseudomonas]|uniref:hypothetical protein n=1 Tax=unclassified Pseudomonas TaxID=196821 RepID=UPI0030D82CF0